MDKPKAIIFGAGIYGEKIYLNVKDKYQIICFFDNKIEKDNTHFKGVKVLKPTSLNNFHFKIDVVIIASEKYSNEIYSQLKNELNVPERQIQIPNDLKSEKFGHFFSEVKKIPYDKDSIKIYWSMGSACNYKCSYCFQKSIKRTMPSRSKKEINNLVKNIKTLKNKKITIDLVGGEPTIFPYYEEIVLQLEKLNNVVSIQTETNLSKDLKYFKRIINNMTNKEKLVFSASYHHEYSNFDEFMEKIIFLSKCNVGVRVTVMSHPSKFKEIKFIYEKVKSLIINDVPINFAVVLDCGIPDSRYKEEDLKWIEKANIRIGENLKKEKENISIKYLENDKVNTVKTTSRNSITKGLNTFKNMKCMSGIEMIRIREDGEILPANCFTSSYQKQEYFVTKNAFKENESLLFEYPIECPFDRCSCAADISTTKYR